MLRKQEKLILKWVSSLLTAFYLLLAFVSQSPQIHSLIHKDASSEQHHCVITLIAQSQILTSDTAVCVFQQNPLIKDLEPFDCDVLSSFNYPSNCSRAPPVVS